MAYYKMREMPDLQGTGKRKTYPQMVITQMTALDDLLEEMSEETTFGEHELRGMVGLLARHMAREMRRGHSVKIDGIGVFSPELGLKKDAEEETPDGDTRRNARSVKVDGIRFRADKELVYETGKGIRLERTATRPSLTPMTPEARAARLAKARAYLNTHPFMRVSDYRELTRIPLDTARKELRAFADDPESGIGSTGRGSHKIYVKKN